MKIPENPTTDDIYMILGSGKYSRFITTLTDNVYDQKKYILEDIIKLVNQGILPDRTDCRMMDATMGIEYGMSTGRLNPDVYSWLMSLSMKEFIALILEISKICTTVGSVPFCLNAIQIQMIERGQGIIYRRIKMGKQEA